MATTTHKTQTVDTTATDPNFDGDRNFHLFSQLPTELRMTIWRLACPPRFIEVGLEIYSAEIIRREGGFGVVYTDRWFLNSTEPIPAVSCVSCESRQFFLEDHVLFQSQVKDPEHDKKIQLYINPRIDVIFTNSIYDDKLLNPLFPEPSWREQYNLTFKKFWKGFSSPHAQRDRLRHLAIPSEGLWIWIMWPAGSRSGFELLRYFPSLRELILVFKDGSQMSIDLASREDFLLKIQCLKRVLRYKREVQKEPCLNSSEAGSTHFEEILRKLWQDGETEEGLKAMKMDG